MKPGRILLAITFFLFFTVQAQSKVSISFEIKGMQDGFCKIVGMLGNNNYLVDTLPAKNGKALYTRNELLQGGLYYFVFPDQRSFVQFLVDKEQQFSMHSDTADIIGHMKINESVDNTLFYENQQFEAAHRKRLDSIETALKLLSSDNQFYISLNALKETLIKERKDYLRTISTQYPHSFFTYFKISGQNPVLQYPKKPNGTLDTTLQVQTYRNEYWNNTDISDEKLLRTPVIANKLKTYITQLVPQNPDSIIKYAVPLIEKSRKCPECFKFIVNWIAIQYEKPSIMGDEKILVYMADNYFTDEIAGSWFKENPYELTKIRLKVNSMRPSMLGSTGQDLRCKNLNGVYENMYDLKTPIKIAFLYDPDCSHCQEEAPKLQALVTKWKDKVSVYALSLDDNETKWREFVAKYHTDNFHNVFDPKMESLYYKKYHIDVTPEIYVLDSNNKIVGKDLHPEQLEEVFNQILNKNQQ
ncbi:MAG: TlpA disulfide reductase family protein [Chitinophagales bacterium]